MNFRRDFLKTTRILEGMNLEALGTLVEVSAVTIHRWESGKAVPRPAHVKKLSEVLSVPSEQFYSLNGNEEKAEDESKAEKKPDAPKRARRTRAGGNSERRSR